MIKILPYINHETCNLWLWGHTWQDSSIKCGMKSCKNQAKAVGPAAMVEYMRPKRYIFAGWATTLVAVAGAAWVFPAIAEKAASQRESAVWQVRAEAFQGVDLSAIEISGHAETLADFHTDKTIENALMRDVAMTNDLMGVPAQTFHTAKFKSGEQRCLAEAVYYEARSETKSGQKAVAEVVQNRVKSKHYPNTICGVVYQGAERTTGCQFSFACDGSTMKEPRGKHWKRSQDIATLMITGGVKPFTDRSTHYHTVAVNPHWSGNLRATKNIGYHKFYKFKFRERPAPSASVSVAPPT